MKAYFIRKIIYLIPIVIGISLITFLLFRVEKREGTAEESGDDTPSLRRAVTGFIAAAAVIIVAGVFLIHASKNIASGSALSGSFIGAILVAVVTSLPELATSIGALHIGAYDMIMGNLFGSNMFNILTIFFADLAFRRGSIFSGLGSEGSDQLMISLLGITMAAITIVGIAYRSKKRVLGMGMDAMSLLIVYLISASLIVARGIDL
jgi:cation:H+ antiporter